MSYEEKLEYAKELVEGIRESVQTLLILGVDVEKEYHIDLSALTG